MYVDAAGVHDVLKSNGKKDATIDVEGMVLDLVTRKAVIPSPELLHVFNLCPRTPDFGVMPELRRAK